MPYAAVCCRRKQRGEHGFTRETELHIIPGAEDFDGTEKAAGYFAIDANTMDKGNQYDTIHATPEVNPIYAEIGENSAAANGANLSKGKCSQNAKEGSPVNLYDTADKEVGPVNLYDTADKEVGPVNLYDTADGAMAFSGDKGEVATENYEIMMMSAPAAAYSNTATGM